MTTQIGDLGEQLVSKWLESQCYCILHHKWRCRWGEIDIIARDKNSSTLIFTEVKTRSNSNWDSYGLEAVSLSKQRKISKTAILFLANHTEYIDFYMRFDVAAVKYQKVHNHQQVNIISKYNLQEKYYNFHQLRNKFISEINEGYYLQIINYLTNAFEFNQE